MMPTINLILLPGLDGTGALFRPLIKALPNHIVPHVVSYPNEIALGYSELLPLVLASLPTEEPFVILGESFSGPLALLAAATCPKGLQGVILCASFVSCPQSFIPKWGAHYIAAFLFRMYPLFTRLKARLGGYATPELNSLSALALSQVTAPVLAHRLRAVVRVDVRSLLQNCEVPMLYMRGDYDRLVPNSYLKVIERLQPQMQVARLPAPHMVLQTQSVQSATAISRFIACCVELG